MTPSGAYWEVLAMLFRSRQQCNEGRRETRKAQRVQIKHPKLRTSSIGVANPPIMPESTLCVPDAVRACWEASGATRFPCDAQIVEAWSACRACTRGRGPTIVL